VVYKGKGGIQYDLSSKPLAVGGEGEIYDVIGQSGLVAKIYKPGKASVEKERKLVKMVNEPPSRSVLSQIAWPQDVLYNAMSFVGFIMTKMETHEALNVIYEFGSSAKYPDMTWENRLIIAENLCAVLDSVHAVGHVCGDFNPKNITVNPNTGEIVFLDTDSYHIQDDADTYRCDVGIPEYLPVEVQKKMRGGGTLSTAKLPTFSQDTDNFALAIHIFQLLMNGVHPFACAIIPSQASITAPQPSDNILKGEFPFMMKKSGVKIPVFAPEISVLPREIQNLFKRAFVEGHSNPKARPSPVEWHKALRNLRNELNTCNSFSYHQYYKFLPRCPWCEINNNFSQANVPKQPTLTQTIIKPPAVTPPPPLRPVTQNRSYNSPPNKRPQKSKQGTRDAALLIQIGAIMAWLLTIIYVDFALRPFIIFVGVPIVGFSLIFFQSRAHVTSRVFGLLATLLVSLFVLLVAVTEGGADLPFITRVIELSYMFNGKMWETLSPITHMFYYAYGLGNIVASIMALGSPKFSKTKMPAGTT
jgi:DNA-binding helix-hairpin-helix protein with protein kinase domain